MVTGSNDVDEIYRKMAVIRRELHAHVSESVAGAEAVVDWGRYTWTYPWIALGAAAAAGYLVYSASHRVKSDTARLADLAETFEASAGASATNQERSRTVPKLLLAVGGFLLPVAVRASQNYMLQWLERQYPARNAPRTVPSPPSGQRGGRTGQSVS